MKNFNEFKEELQSMLKNMEKEHAAKCESIETYVHDFFREWDGDGEKNKMFLPDPMMLLIILKLSEAEDKIREAQVCLSQKWYDGLMGNYIDKFSDFQDNAEFRDGKLVNENEV